jgi:hypothetical protein
MFRWSGNLSTKVCSSTGLVYIVTDSDGNNPKPLHLNRMSAISLPPAGEESSYVGRMILVVNAKVVSPFPVLVYAFDQKPASQHNGVMTSFHEGSPFIFLSPTGQDHRFGKSGNAMPKGESDTIATIIIENLVEHVLGLFPKTQASDLCSEFFHALLSQCA